MFGSAFSAAALFLLGLRMVGQMHQLQGANLVIPCLLICVKWYFNQLNCKILLVNFLITLLFLAKA